MSRKDLNRKVGEFISPINTTLRPYMSVEQALAYARKHQVKDKIFYFYVVDEAKRLKGVVSTRSLLLSPPQKKIGEIFEEEVITLRSSQTLKEAVDLLTDHRLLALPVIDEEGRLLGIVDIQLYLEEAVDVAKAKRSSTDLFQVLGISLEEGKARSIWDRYKVRMPWIFCNMLGGIACAVISRIFEVVLLDVILLAMFIPLVLTLSESISMQSMTYSLGLLGRPKISSKRVFRQVISEWKMVLLLAITCGILVGLISLFWQEGVVPALAIGVGILCSVTISGMMGALIPLLLHAGKLDPKVAAGPVVLMFADVITTTIYLGLSTLWLVSI